MSQVVAGRTREIGLRMVLGAQLSYVQKLILKQEMLLAVIGSLGGLLVAFGGACLMKSLLYGVSASDPITFALVAMLLFEYRVSRLLDPGAQSQSHRPNDCVARGVSG